MLQLWFGSLEMSVPGIELAGYGEALAQCSGKKPQIQSQPGASTSHWKVREQNFRLRCPHQCRVGSIRLPPPRSAQAMGWFVRPQHVTGRFCDLEVGYYCNKKPKMYGKPLGIREQVETGKTLRQVYMRNQSLKETQSLRALKAAIRENFRKINITGSCRKGDFCLATLLFVVTWKTGNTPRELGKPV